MDGARELAVAVIQQAWDDSARCLAGRGSVASKPRPIEQQRARAFLLEGGDWGASRAEWCQMAGIDPDALRDRARQRLGVA